MLIKDVPMGWYSGQPITQAWLNGVALLQSSAVSPTNYIAYFPMKNDANDATGTYTSTVTGAITFDGTSGYFDGNDYIQVSPIIPVGLQGRDEFTVSVWLKREQGGRDEWYIGNRSTGDQGWQFASYKDLTNVFFNLRTVDGWVGVEFVGKAYSDPADTDFSHYVCMYDGVDIVAFLDGVEVGRTATTSDILANTSTSSQIGCLFSNSLLPIASMGEIKYFDYALTQADITALFNEGM